MYVQYLLVEHICQMWYLWDVFMLPLSRKNSLFQHSNYVPLKCKFGFTHWNCQYIAMATGASGRGIGGTVHLTQNPSQISPRNWNTAPFPRNHGTFPLDNLRHHWSSSRSCSNRANVCGWPGNFHQSGRAISQLYQKEVNPSHLTPPLPCHVMFLLRHLTEEKEEEIPNDFTIVHLEALRCCHSYWKV